MATGKLGSVVLAANTDTQLFIASVDQTFNIRFCNQNATVVAIRTAIGTGSSPAAEDYLSFDTPVQANGVLEEIALVVAAGEKVWVRSSAGNVSVNAFGL